MPVLLALIALGLGIYLLKLARPEVTGPAAAAGLSGGLRQTERRSALTMSVLALLALGLGTYLLRLAGPVLRQRITLPGRVEHVLAVAPVVLLIALAATLALTQGHQFAGWARPAGVAAGALLAVRRAPLPLVVAGAIVTTAMLRLAGIS
jgi:branched-subunit amino acid transport protein